MFMSFLVQLRIAKVKERLPYSCDSTLLGQLLLTVTGSSLGAEQLRQRAGHWAQQVEVLGYVV